MLTFLKRLFLITAVLLIIAQLIPRKNDNNGSIYSMASIAYAHHVPADVEIIFQNSCYDCHSNKTVYPWYAQIQPVSIWLNHHVEEGKEELNFSEFGNYSLRRQYHKLEEIAEQVDEGEMPLSSYTLIHKNAALSDDQKKSVVDWAKNLRDSFKLAYPADSLNRKRR